MCIPERTMDKALIDDWDEDEQGKEPTRGGFLREVFRVVCAGATVATLLLVVSAIAATVFVRQAVHRIHVDPQALSDALRDAAITAIREGDSKQKLETIASLKNVRAPDAAPFVPALAEAAKDENPRVRQAASEALDRIVPDATKEDEER
jgi:hypothetical protein